MDNKNKVFEKYKKWIVVASMLAVVAIVIFLDANRDKAATETVSTSVAESTKNAETEAETTVIDHRQEFLDLLEYSDYLGAVLIYNEKLLKSDQEDCLAVLYEVAEKVQKDWDASAIDFEQLIAVLGSLVKIDDAEFAKTVRESMKLAELNHQYSLFEEHLAASNIESAVDIYNIYLFGSKYSEEADNLFMEFMEASVKAWEDDTLSYDMAKAVLATMKELEQDSLLSVLEEKLSYIEIEHTGRTALQNIAELLEGKEYISCLNVFVSVDETFSRYEELLAYKTEIVRGILDRVASPDTVKDFEACIEYVSDCLNIIGIADLEERQEELEKELRIELEIQDIILNAKEQYELGLIEEAFFTLACGIEQYPDSEELPISLIDLRDDYIIDITKKAVFLCEEEKYKEALEIVENAIEIYECEEFSNLQESVKEQKSFLYKAKNDVVRTLQSITAGWTAEEYNVNQSAGEAGAYIIKSGKKLILGDYSEEDITILTIGGNLVASIAGVDLLFDLRDLSYDVTHWNEEEYFVVRLATDVVALIPVIGAVKYFEHVKDAAHLTDDVADMIKNSDRTADVVDNVSDSAKNASNTAGVVNDIAKNADSVNDIAKAKESAKDFLTNFRKDYEPVGTRNSKLAGKSHPKTGINYKMRKLKYSNGKKIRGVFPEFDSYADIQLPKRLYDSPAEDHLDYCLEALVKDVKSPFSKYKKYFNEEEVQILKNGKLPPGYTWHHSEFEGLLQLVETAIHQASGHDGGMSLWGVGY